MSDIPQVLLAHHLKALKLPTFLREHERLARQCATEGVDHLRYLLRLAELELIEREQRMVERRCSATTIVGSPALCVASGAGEAGCPSVRSAVTAGFPCPNASCR
jgi:hypothetical protein